MGWFAEWLAAERMVWRLFGRQRLTGTLRTLWTAAVWGPPGRPFLRAVGRWRCVLCGATMPSEGLNGHARCMGDAASSEAYDEASLSRSRGAGCENREVPL